MSDTRAAVKTPPAAPVDGSTRAEAARRLAQYGPNEIVEKERSPLPTG